MASGPDIVLYRRRSPETDRRSRELLLQAAVHWSGLSAEQLGDVEVNQWGKPRFSGAPDVHFSVSHSGDWWLCGFSAQPLGVDVQIHKAQAPVATLSRRFFHPTEDAFLARDGYRCFFDLWSAKESWVKYIGRGFYEDPGSFSVVAPDGSFPAKEQAELRLLPFESGYSLCVCAQQLGSVEIRDF